MHMQKFGRTAAISGTALALALGAAPAMSSASVLPGASEIGVVGHPAPEREDRFTFTRRHENYWHRDRIGQFSARVDLDGEHSRRYPMRWSFQITSERLKDMARGRAVCTTERDDDHDRREDREVIRVGDTWRSDVAWHRIRRAYELEGECKFRVRDGGRRGEARVSFEFRYEIDPGAHGSDPHEASAAFETDYEFDR
ncbi:hypothetical protein [Spirillospora albida]|uniref:hypothetical protein n=1 Tax=Spirillospora albida TaxID=58123 RepID=UPI0004C2AF31|nr:hypothetical protein [Spirillospora albida]